MTDLGTRIARLENRLAAIERSPRLGSAAIDDTAVEVRDDTGSLRALVGQQGDGTTAVNVVNGPTPAAPTAPLVASVIGGVAAQWDGQLVADTAVPLDFARVEVHAAATSGFTPTEATLQGTIETPQGATVVIPTTTPLYVRLLTRTTSGTASTPSDENGPIAPAMIVADDVADGIITGTKLAADAIDGKVITGATMRTAASGQRIQLAPDNAITIYNASGQVVSTISPAGYKIWDETGTDLLAEVTLTGGAFSDPGFVARSVASPHLYSFFGNGNIEWANDNRAMAVNPGIRVYGLAAEDDETDMIITPGAYFPSSKAPRMTLTTSAAGASEFRVDSLFGAKPNINLDGPITAGETLDVTKRVLINGVDQGKGLKEFQAIQANSATTTTTEIAAITAASTTFENGRAYRITYHGLLLSTVANDIVRCRVWRGSIGGTGVSLVDSINTHQIPVANQHVLMDMSQIVTNTTGSDISAVLIGSVLRTVGTGNVQIVANAANPAWLLIEDIGLATDYPSARAV
ncbi:hypothetical protein ACFWV1_25960 [Streptomyces sp. NPDC058700]|uniref:hypothetical protein n=1 Tax=Streptomyces sp. NPDC058700 TaxID=3346607 RepID=UPI00364E777F